MATLIVDPDRESREIAYRLVKWADHRHSVEMFDSGASAWNVAAEWRPHLLLCELYLPDMTGAEFCKRLRTKLPNTKFIAYTREEKGAEDAEGAFDGVLLKPPSRLAILSYLNAVKKRKKSEVGVASDSASVFLDERRSRPWRRRKHDSTSAPIKVLVRMADEVDTPFSFSVPLPTGSTVGEVLRQIGKTCVTWFTLNRNGSEVDATINTPISDGDILLLKT
jgi:CheY-like chemotaxis protein